LERKRVLLFSAILIIVVTLPACDTGTFTAFLDTGTATPTRTARPTFTPRASPTPEDTATPEATPTLEPTQTPTRRIVPTVRPATKAPATAAPPPAPKFSVQVTDSFDCPQGSQGAVYEVLMRVNRSTPPPIFLGDYVIELRSPDGSFRKTTVTVPDDQQIMSMLGGANCHADNFWPYNAKIDAAEVRGLPGPYFVRVIKSLTDSTPLSPNVTVNFLQSVRWIIYFSAPQ
jgi:hypothetical protein